MDEHEFEKQLSFEKIYEAYKLASRGKRNKDEVIRFELDLSRNLWQIVDELKSYSYRLSGYHHFTIYDPKKREIQALSFRDRIVQHWLCDNILKDYFEKRLIYDNAACREGKGTHFAMNRLSIFLREHYREYGADGYILKYDIRHYFDEIDHKALKWMLRKIPDKAVLGLLYHIINSYNKAQGKGLPIGNQTSQWFALYYLDMMDRLVKEKMRIKHYVRYMDDGVLICNDKEYLRSVLAEMEKLAKRLGLEFNEKTQIFPLRQGVDFLGFRFYLTDSGKVIKRLRTSNKKKFKKRMKAFQKEYSVGKKSLKEIQQSIKSYNGHLKHGHTYKLKKKVFKKFVLKRKRTSKD